MNRFATLILDQEDSCAATIELCIQQGFLADYLMGHRSEVEKIMMTMKDPDYIRRASERTEKIKEVIAFGRDAGMSDKQIKEAIIRRYDLTPTYAQNFLDDDTDPEDCRPEAL